MIEAEAPSGARKVQKELSRGTAEQLYLALRFGYIKNLASKGRAYPVVVDEALVNFDPDRASAAIQGFLELAATHQVLLFTCHPYIKDIAVALEPAVTVVTM